MGLEIARRAYARRIQRWRPRPTERWHLDEMVVVIRGRQFYLCVPWTVRAKSLDFLVQSRRNARAAIRLMRKLLKKQGFAPATIVTDKLRSYGAAIRLLALSAQHEQGLRKAQSGRKFASSRCDDDVRKMPPVQIARVRAAVPRRPCDRLGNLFNVQRHLVSRRTLRELARRCDETVAASDATVT